MLLTNLCLGSLSGCNTLRRMLASRQRPTDVQVQRFSLPSASCVRQCVHQSQQREDNDCSKRSQARGEEN